MKEYRLGDLVSIDSGYAFKSNLFNENEGIPIIRIRDVNSGKSKTYYLGEYDEKYIVKNDDMLISMDGNFVIKKWIGGNALLNQRVCRIKSINKLLLNDYIYRILPIQLKKIEDKTSFVTVKHLSIKDINEIIINLPNIETQNKIIKILDKSQELIDKRKAQIEELDKLIKSVFYNIFNDKSDFRKLKLENIVINKSDIVDGPFGSNLKTDDYVDNGIRVIQINNIGENCFRDKNKRFITNEKFKILKKHSVYPGDVIVAKMGEPIGRTCILPKYIEKGVIVADCMRIKPNNIIIDNKYLSFLLNTEDIKNQFTKYSQGSTRIRLNLTMLRKVQIPLPNVELQKKFSVILEKIEKQKELLQQNLLQLENNFNSLMQKAFKGELF